MQPRPNILFCLADDAGMHFGAYGCPWVRTPAFDRVAREGLLFQQAYTCNAKCAPSRAAILTGRNSWQLKDAANHQCYFPPEFRTVFEALALQDYHVGHTAKGWAPGNPGEIDGRPRLLTGPAYSDLESPPPTEQINGCDYAANFAAFLRDKPPEQPFCFWYGCTEPHRPYRYRSGIELNGRHLDEIDHVPGIWPDNEIVRTDLLDYGMEIEHYDRHLGRMLEHLEALGELDNTLIVATSDNGMPFPRVKGQEYYLSNHLPLAIRWGRGIRAPGRIIDDKIGFIDFAPTFLEVAKVDPNATGMAPMAGHSFTDLFETEREGIVDARRDRVLIGKERHDVGRPGDVGYPIRGLFKDDFLYLINFEPDRWPAGNPETGYMNSDGSPTKSALLALRHDPERSYYWQQSFGKRPPRELYNVKTDPDCLDNLAEREGYSDLCRALDGQLRRELQEQGDPRITGDGPPLDENPTAALANRNYYGRFLRGEIKVAGWIRPEDIQEPG